MKARKNSIATLVLGALVFAIDPAQAQSDQHGDTLFELINAGDPVAFEQALDDVSRSDFLSIRDAQGRMLGHIAALQEVDAQFFVLLGQKNYQFAVPDASGKTVVDYLLEADNLDALKIVFQHSAAALARQLPRGSAVRRCHLNEQTHNKTCAWAQYVVNNRK